VSGELLLIEMSVVMDLVMVIVIAAYTTDQMNV
jgi:hypothetical protein